MLKHFNIVVIYLVTLFVLLYFNQTGDVHWIWFVLLFIFFGAIEFYGAAYIQSNFHIEAFCKRKTAEKIVSITFDDGPSAQTLNILDVLNKHQVKAGFFCIGRNIQGNEAILKKTFSEGHLIGNHSYSHDVLFDFKNSYSLEKDLQKASEEIKNVTGLSPLYFRPPYGVTTPGLAKAVKNLKYQVIGWNIRSFDTKGESPDTVLNRITSKLSPGSVILLHDTVAGTEIVLEKLLMHLKTENYKVVPVDELVQKPAYAKN